MSSATQPLKESVSLYFREGSSDKVYHAQLEPKDSGFVVNFQYGRRGSTLTPGTKTQTPVEYDKAKKIFDKLVAEKKGRGYTEGEEGTPYQGSDKAGQKSGIQCQLLNFIDEDRVQSLLRDPAWMMQEKKDGRRLLVRKKGDVVEGINRKGLIVGISSKIEKAVAKLPFNQVILDGEAIGDTYYVFDCLLVEPTGPALTQRNLKTEPYAVRHGAMRRTLEAAPSRTLVPVAGWLTNSEKLAAYKILEQTRAEGVVFKKMDAPWNAGRPNSGGTQLKYKFYATATCVVLKQNDQRSVSVGVGRFDGKVAVGNVTIPPNHDVPREEQLIEVRYLYAYPEGCLYQPTYLGVREDKDEPDIYDSLKFKQQSEGEDDES
jgi:bifunctional non-homologous end joining protein LigD